jgi:hypothetical protein
MRNRHLCVSHAAMLFSLLLFLFAANLAHSDSLELRDGRHLHGKYVGGTSTEISFMADGVVQSLPVSDVLLLVFGEANVEAPLGMSSGSVPAQRPASFDRVAPDCQRAPASAGSRSASRVKNKTNEPQNSVPGASQTPVILEGTT